MEIDSISASSTSATQSKNNNDSENNPEKPLDRDVLFASAKGSASSDDVTQRNNANLLLMDLILLHRIISEVQNTSLDVDWLVDRLFLLMKYGKPRELAGLKDVPRPFLINHGRFFQKNDTGNDQEDNKNDEESWKELSDNEAKELLKNYILKEMKKVLSLKDVAPKKDEFVSFLQHLPSQSNDNDSGHLDKNAIVNDDGVTGAAPAVSASATSDPDNAAGTSAEIAVTTEAAADSASVTSPAKDQAEKCSEATIKADGNDDAGKIKLGNIEEKQDKDIEMPAEKKDNEKDVTKEGNDGDGEKTKLESGATEEDPAKKVGNKAVDGGTECSDVVAVGNSKGEKQKDALSNGATNDNVDEAMEKDDQKHKADDTEKKAGADDDEKMAIANEGKKSPNGDNDAKMSEAENSHKKGGVIESNGKHEAGGDTKMNGISEGDKTNEAADGKKNDGTSLDSKIVNENEGDSKNAPGRCEAEKGTQGGEKQQESEQGGIKNESVDGGIKDDAANFDKNGGVDEGDKKNESSKSEFGDSVESVSGNKAVYVIATPKDIVLVPCGKNAEDKLYEIQSGNKSFFNLVSQHVTGEIYDSSFKRVESAISVVLSRGRGGLTDSPATVSGTLSSLTTTLMSTTNARDESNPPCRFLFRGDSTASPVVDNAANPAAAAAAAALCEVNNNCTHIHPVDAVEFTLVFLFEVFLEKKATGERAARVLAETDFGAQVSGIDMSKPSNVPIENPTDHDVLFGRGGMTNSHHGNRRFRDIITLHRPDYVRAVKNDKPNVARKIVRAIRSASPPGRFLKKGDDGKWYDVGDRCAAEKTSQGLRERSNAEKRQRSALREALRIRKEDFAEEPSAKKIMLMNTNSNVTRPAIPMPLPSVTPILPGVMTASAYGVVGAPSQQQQHLAAHPGAPTHLHPSAPTHLQPGGPAPMTIEAGKTVPPNATGSIASTNALPVADTKGKAKVKIEMGADAKPSHAAASNGQNNVEVKAEGNSNVANIYGLNPSGLNTAGLPPNAVDSDGSILVTDYDILCGRGGLTNHHKGNKRFRDIVALHRPDYVRAPKVQKPSVARVIVRAIRNGDPPGRFLRKNDKTGKWYDIGDKRAAEKTSQALREKSNEERDVVKDPTPSSNPITSPVFVSPTVYLSASAGMSIPGTTVPAVAGAENLNAVAASASAAVSSDSKLNVEKIEEQTASV